MNDDVLNLSVMGETWWYVIRRFDTADEAKTSFDYMHGEAAKLKGRAQIAGYRLLDALPPMGDPRIVVVLGMVEPRVREAADRLDGEPWPMHESHVYGLVMRRIRFLAAANDLQAPGGVYRWDHGDGMRLDDEGRVVPREDP